MSGHSKWHNIKAKKDKADQKRGAFFTKAARAITMAVREGGVDPNMNFSLRLAIDKAKELNVPKENIERAIKKGTGELQDGEILEEILYEGFGPSGVAFLVDTITNNKIRTVSEIKHIFSKNGGSVGSPGSVVWQFERKAVVRIENEEKNNSGEAWDSIELSLMDNGVEDIVYSEDGVEIITSLEKFKSVLVVLEQAEINVLDSGLEWLAKEKIELNNETEEKVNKLVEDLEENDDVRAVFTNQK